MILHAILPEAFCIIGNAISYYTKKGPPDLFVVCLATKKIRQDHPAVFFVSLFVLILKSYDFTFSSYSAFAVILGLTTKITSTRPITATIAARRNTEFTPF